MIVETLLNVYLPRSDDRVKCLILPDSEDPKLVGCCLLRPSSIFEEKRTDLIRLRAIHSW